MRVKLLGTSVTLSSTGNNIDTASEVMVVHDAGGNAGRTLTLTESDGTTVSTLVVNPGFQLVIRKEPSQKLKISDGSDVTATPVSYIG